MDRGTAFKSMLEGKQCRMRARRDETPETIKERRKLPEDFLVPFTVQDDVLIPSSVSAYVARGRQ